MQWGLVPYWAKDPKIAYKTINAGLKRSIPLHRTVKRHRCLIPCDGFSNGRKFSAAKFRTRSSMKDDSPFVFVGLWEGWKDPANNEWVHTCTIITGEPNEFVREIHTRMPVILPEEHHEAWLSGEAGKEVLVPFPADRLRA